METDATRMCALLVGLPDVDVIGVGEWPLWLRVVVEIPGDRPACGCGGGVHRHGIREVDSRGVPVVDVNFLLYFNADGDDVEFLIPSEEYGREWEIVIDTAGDGADLVPRPAGARHSVAGRSLSVLRALESEAPGPPGDSAAASVASQTKDSAD